MNYRKPEDNVFEMIASCTMVIAVIAFTALLYQLITVPYQFSNQSWVHR